MPIPLEIDSPPANRSMPAWLTSSTARDGSTSWSTTPASCVTGSSGSSRTPIWHAVLGVHLTGTFNMTRAAVPTMREQGHGRFVNVTSYTGLHGNVGQANDAAAKAGIIGFTRTTAKELAGSASPSTPSPRTPRPTWWPPSRRTSRRAAAHDSDGPLRRRRPRWAPPSPSSLRRRPATSPVSCCPSTADCRSTAAVRQRQLVRLVA